MVIKPFKFILDGVINNGVSDMARLKVYAAKKRICHVCGKEVKPYTVIMKNDVLSLLEYWSAREDGDICERCDRYHAMTGDFKDATDEEFKLAEEAIKFAKLMLEWWEKDKKLTAKDDGSDMRDWEGTFNIKRWYRERKG